MLFFFEKNTEINILKKKLKYEDNNIFYVLIMSSFASNEQQSINTVDLSGTNMNIIEDDEFEEIEQAIRSSDKNPYGMHAQLSAHKQPYARKALIEFFETNMRIVFIGSSSGDSRSHSVYRGRDGRLYNVHKSAYSSRMDVFYFTEGDIAWAFEENPEGKPDWTMCDDVKKEIAKMNGLNTESETDEDMPSLVDDSDTDDEHMTLPIGRSVSEAIPIPITFSRGVSNL